jgi:hypothetical protein
MRRLAGAGGAVGLILSITCAFLVLRFGLFRTTFAVLSRLFRRSSATWPYFLANFGKDMTNRRSSRFAIEVDESIGQVYVPRAVTVEGDDDVVCQPYAWEMLTKNVSRSFHRKLRRVRCDGNGPNQPWIQVDVDYLRIRSYAEEVGCNFTGTLNPRTSPTAALPITRCFLNNINPPMYSLQSSRDPPINKLPGFFFST